MVSFKMRHKTHVELAERWAKLEGKIRKKARKRAEVAHGSVITMMEPGEKDFTDYFVPFYYKRRDDFNFLGHVEYQNTKFPDHAKHLSVSVLQDRVKIFNKLRHDTRQFREDWRAKDEEIESGEQL